MCTGSRLLSGASMEDESTLCEHLCSHHSTPARDHLLQSSCAQHPTTPHYHSATACEVHVAFAIRARMALFSRPTSPPATPPDGSALRAMQPAASPAYPASSTREPASPTESTTLDDEARWCRPLISAMCTRFQPVRYGRGAPQLPLAGVGRARRRREMRETWEDGVSDVQKTRRSAAPSIYVRDLLAAYTLYIENGCRLFDPRLHISRHTLPEFPIDFSGRKGAGPRLHGADGDGAGVWRWSAAAGQRRHGGESRDMLKCLGSITGHNGGLKVKEIRARLERAGVNTGEAESLEALGIDLDAPWDPEAHDRQMAGLYALDGEDEEEFAEDGEKPTWGDDVDIADIVPEPSTSKAEKKKKKKKKKCADEEEDVGVDIDAMDVNAIPAGGDDDEWDGTEEMRKRKLDEWMDEVYALDFNDIVGGMPTRFHYTSVAPQIFGLSPVDILLAKDTELNEYMRLKELKGKVRERTGAVSGEEAHGRDGQIKKKRKGKKERMKEKGAGVGGEGEATVEGAAEANGDAGSKRKRDLEEIVEAGDNGQPSDAGKKKRRRKKKDSAVEV
ncbi:KRI1-like family C-terminal-domain-containing protein [Mycena galericulata]|nr:KRI1-like family C-terminal-domain-containing protein [Mycena galericulata]